MDYAALRERMVAEQLQARGITDRRVLEAFRKVERHRFIAPAARSSAYSDFPVPLTEGQTISQPYMVGLMVERLELGASALVLEIGTGSGYQTAILAELAAAVYSIERFETLAQNATALLGELGYTNVRIRAGDGTLGWPDAGPFDAIVVSAAAPAVPPPLVGQLKEGGRMVLPLGGRQFSQTLTVLRKHQGILEKQEICGCVFVPLVGRYGF